MRRQNPKPKMRLPLLLQPPNRPNPSGMVGNFLEQYRVGEIHHVVQGSPNDSREMIQSTIFLYQYPNPEGLYQCQDTNKGRISSNSSPSFGHSWSIGYWSRGRSNTAVVKPYYSLVTVDDDGTNLASTDCRYCRTKE
jgi:hypothetical protein